MEIVYDEDFTLEELQKGDFVFQGKDFDELYEKHLKFESKFHEKFRYSLTKEEFISEVNLGYGESEYLQCARIVSHETGFYYDNEYIG